MNRDMQNADRQTNTYTDKQRVKKRGGTKREKLSEIVQCKHIVFVL